MLENLTSNISRVLSNVTGKYKLSESNIKDILKKFRKSLLEADVSWDVVKFIVNNIKLKLTDIEIVKKISPNDIFLKVVNDEFINILGGNNLNKNFFLSKKIGLNIILVLGLHGVGKTTSVVKLAKYLKTKQNKTSLVVSCDVYRPAAIEQLEILAKKSFIECFTSFDKNESVENILKKVLNYVEDKNFDYLIVDSAGRLHVDDFMMNEIKFIYKKLNPAYVLCVVDSMSGQNIVDIISSFSKEIDISGFILTKMDSDTRGGVILSLGYLTKKPIRFLGTGESLDDFELFYPERIVSRILGMGDISGLLDKINENISDVNKKNLSEKILNNSWNLNDFKLQLTQMIKMGNIKEIISKIPGNHLLSDSQKDKINEKYLISMLAAINSMTLKEKNFPNIINGSRKKRIAYGSGTSIQIINNLLKQYDKIKKKLNKNIFKSQ